MLGDPSSALAKSTTFRRVDRTQTCTWAKAIERLRDPVMVASAFASGSAITPFAALGVLRAGSRLQDRCHAGALPASAANARPSLLMETILCHRRSAITGPTSVLFTSTM